MALDPVESYLRDLSEIYRRGGGVAEESYYGPLENLLNEIGRKLKPRVRCVGQLKNTGAGEPDFGLYTTNQFQRARDARPMEGQLPERGVVECKPWKDDSFARTGSTQVSSYWKRYGLVLVTNSPGERPRSSSALPTAFGLAGVLRDLWLGRALGVACALEANYDIS